MHNGTTDFELLIGVCQVFIVHFSFFFGWGILVEKMTRIFFNPFKFHLFYLESQFALIIFFSIAHMRSYNLGQ